MRGLVVVLASLALTGCASLFGSADHPRVDGLFDFSDATYDSGPGAYQVNVRGQVAVPANADARDAWLELAAGEDCARAPAQDAWVHLSLGNLAAGSSTNLRDAAALPSLPLPEPRLWYKLTLGKSSGGGHTVDQGCGPLRAA
jgi:hypothetical protein